MLLRNRTLLHTYSCRITSHHEHPSYFATSRLPKFISTFFTQDSNIASQQPVMKTEYVKYSLKTSA
jgi:hypothetical protein